MTRRQKHYVITFLGWKVSWHRSLAAARAKIQRRGEDWQTDAFKIVRLSDGRTWVH